MNVVYPEGRAVYSYAGYVAHGGRIDEGNYMRVMKAVEQLCDGCAGDNAVRQTRIAAEISGISLEAIRERKGIDPRCIYGILRTDNMPSATVHHHAQMCDQQLLVEVLRMLEDESARVAMIAAHPNISFD
jgi:hypothetical protein